MSQDDNEEFIAMVLSFAERKSMTISNIKDAIQEAIAYMEDNAILSTAPENQYYSGTVKKEEYSCPLKQVNEQASGCSIDKIAGELSQKIQESV